MRDCNQPFTVLEMEWCVRPGQLQLDITEVRIVCRRSHEPLSACVLREWNIVISHRRLVIIGTQTNSVARHLR